MKIFSENFAKTFLLQNELYSDIYHHQGRISKQNAICTLLVFHHFSLRTKHCFQPKGSTHFSLLQTNLDFAKHHQHFLEAKDR